MRKKIIIFCFIFLFIASFIFRLYQVFTQAVLVDEQMLAWETQKINAHFIPVHFFGFGWGENTALAYLATPFHRMFPFFDIVLMLRLIVLFSHLAFIFIFYLFLKLLLGKNVAYISTFFLLFSPWSVRSSTIAYNAYLLPTLIILGLYFIFLGIRTNKILWYALASVPVALSFYAYASSFLAVPIIILLTVIIYHKEIKVRALVSFLFLTFVMALPIVFFYFKTVFHLYQQMTSFWIFSLPSLVTTRFSDVSIFSLYGGYMILAQYIFNLLLHFALPTLLFDAGRGFSQFYFMYWWDVVFIMFGLYVCSKKWKENAYRFMLCWFLTGPITSSFVNNSLAYNFTRDIHMFPVLVALSVLGCYYMIIEVKKLDKGFEI